MKLPPHPENIRINFILSTGRTGSTLLSTMLNMHPNVISVSEEPFAYNLIPKYEKIKKWTSETIQEYCYDFYLFSEGKLEPQFGTKADLEHILESHKEKLDVQLAIRLTYLCFFPEKEKSRVNSVVDKQLKFQFVLENVAQTYPHAKFIILHRDPRDNSLVKWLRAQKQQREGNYIFFAYMWKHVYGTLLKKKKTIGEDRFLEVKYEDLVTHPEEQLNKIAAFLDIPYDPVMLNYDEHVRNEIVSEKTKEKLSTSVRQHISMFHEGLTKKTYTDKIGFWKEKMKQEDVNTVWSIAGSLAEKIGYKTGENFRPMKHTLFYYASIAACFLSKILVGRVYYSSPFFVRYFVKKLRYGKNFKSGKYATKDFYKTTLPKSN